ncbi:hypothetical protein [Polaribacter sp. 20A6]|uniref:hypothetical protein n=1 Tax=Polaribacter sp. 20A6 TaxID=2687289 RepID=UPI0013FD4ECE|nr:hypothetical protein [Polaribacter sp. 20A6]
MENQGNWNSMYDFPENELISITSTIDRLKKNDSIKSTEIHIKELRKEIEKVFQDMN